MDYNQSDSDQTYLPEPLKSEPFPDAPNRMSQAALICGILSLVGIFFNASVFFGAFAIIFALLSKRNRLSRQAKAGIRMGAIGIGISAFVIIASIAILVSTGLFGKYARRIAEIDPEDPTAVTTIENDLMEDLAKAYGIDPSEIQQDQNSPLDPTIENDSSYGSETV